MVQLSGNWYSPLLEGCSLYSLGYGES